MGLDQDKLLTDKNTDEMDFDSQWDDIQLTPVNTTKKDSQRTSSFSTESDKKSSHEGMDAVDFDSDWDDIQLTPVNSTPDESQTSGARSTEASNPRIEIPKQNISSGFKELDESFMYLGVLKKMALPDAMRFFEKKFDSLLKFFERIWDNKAYPDMEKIFGAIDEDYQKLKNLIHSGDAIQPIYDNLKKVYENVEEFRDAGMERQQAMGTLQDLFDNRK